MALGGLALLVLSYSLLAMAAKGDEYLDQLEFEPKGGNDSPSIELTSLGHSFLIPPGNSRHNYWRCFLKDSFCGLCEDCHLGTKTFMKPLKR